MGRLKTFNKNYILLILIFVPLIMFMVYQVYNRNELLKEFDLSSVTIYEIHKKNNPLNKTNRNIAKYKYEYNGIIYNKSSEFYSFDVHIGDIYLVKISKIDPEVHEVDFSKKINEIDPS